MAGEHRFQSFCPQHLEHFLKPKDQGDRRGICRLVFDLRIPFLPKVEIKRAVFRFLCQLPGLLTHTDEGQPGRQHQRYLRSRNDHINTPRVGLDIEHAQRRNGVDHQNRSFVWLDNLRQSFHIVRDAGRGLAGLHIDCLDRRIFLEGIGNRLRVDCPSPFDFNLHDLGAKCLTQLDPPLSELPSVYTKRLVTGGQKIRHCPFHSPCARGG